MPYVKRAELQKLQARVEQLERQLKDNKPQTRPKAQGRKADNA